LKKSWWHRAISERGFEVFLLCYEKYNVFCERFRSGLKRDAVKHYRN
jgi:hypothetical protein